MIMIIIIIVIILFIVEFDPNTMETKSRLINFNKNDKTVALTTKKVSEGELHFTMVQFDLQNTYIKVH